MVAGISGYAVSVPRLRIKREEYAKAWGSFAAPGISEKAVLGYDEDVLTIATKVSRKALESVPLLPGAVSRLAFASTTPPYLEKLLSGTISAGLGIPNQAFVSDHTTSTRAGTEALLVAFDHLRANGGGHAVVAAADAPRASMWNAFEHPLGAGAAAFVLSTEDLIAELEGHASYASEHFGERFKPRDESVIHDLGVRRFSESSFLTNTMAAANALLMKLGRKAEEFAHVVFQQPDARMPGSAASRLSVSEAQIASGMVSPFLGDLGAASVPVGLAAALDAARVGDRILVVSYGSGAGSDALSFRVVSERRPASTVQAEASQKVYIDYVQYLKIRGAIL